MAVGYARFKQALERCEGNQWRIFERLAHACLSTEWPSLRPTASESGDDGRDAMVFATEDDESVVAQYSVRKDVRTKILQTCARLNDTSPSVRMLIYVTNQTSPSDISALRKKCRDDYGIYLDYRGQEWLLTERNASAKISAEAEEFMQVIAAGPSAPGAAVPGRALSDLESRAAFVYLGLQWADENREKELTTLSFEALVRAALRNTTSDDRLGRQGIRDQVRRILPAHPRNLLDGNVDRALSRLSKVHIRHWQKVDEFCLTWEERQRLDNRIAELEVLNASLDEELWRLLELSAAESGHSMQAADRVAFTAQARDVIERIFLERGELFATAVVKNSSVLVPFKDIEAAVFGQMPAKRGNDQLEPRVLISALQALLLDPIEDVRNYLRSLAETYTLFAFMRETPDVQSAFLKIFSDADIWLDTNVVLPLLAEDLLDEPRRAHTHLLAAARESEQRLYVTEGVIEEIVTHINRCRTHRVNPDADSSYANTPFLLSSFLTANGTADGFPQWIENFVGSARPEDDMSDYLSQVHGIETQSLEVEAASLAQTDMALHAAISEIWYAAREARSQRQQALGAAPEDPGTMQRLVRHDVENYAGVLVRRETQRERRSAFGYKTWWLTLDGTAFRAHQRLKDQVAGRVPHSPAISPDFMLNYLAIGPVRRRLSKQTEEALPLMLNMSVLDAVPPALVELADEIRSNLVGLPSHVVSRKIRDTLDEARVMLGPIGQAGEEGLTKELRARLVEQAKTR